MRVSHSRIEQFKNCPFKYKLRYLDGLRTLPDDAANNALYLGTALHTGLEKGVQAAIQEYYGCYPVITDLHINETMKLEKMIPKAKALIPDGFHEIKIDLEYFVGFIDLLVPAGNAKGSNWQDYDEFDMYDFKYSNNVDHYMESVQLHIYKYFFEKAFPRKKIRDLYYLFVPKTFIRQKKTEELFQFRQRLSAELNKMNPRVVPVPYDENKIVQFIRDTNTTLETTEFEKNETKLCGFCDYKEFCMEGIDYMITLPSTERRNIEKINKKVIWLYGAPFCGKTTFANQFPNPLMLNSDGNIRFVDAPFIAIKDEVTAEGRMTKRKYAWEVFEEVVDELEKKDNKFKTIIVDLLEDMYEHCRLFMYDELGITHESDDSFRAWDKIRTRFLSVLRRLMNLDYENFILISHEDSSKDITKKSGDKITSIKPNLNDKASNKMAGMVDIVARVVADSDKRTLSFKSDEVVFGGGRLTVTTTEIGLDYTAFLKVYEDANKGKSKKKETSHIKPTEQEEESVTETDSSETPAQAEESKPASRRRRAR